MEGELSVLLRDGAHGGAGVTHLALKAEQFSLTVSRSVLQNTFSKAISTTAIFTDLGENVPAITLSGIVDNIGTDQSQVTTNEFFHMEKLSIGSEDYYIPYKNYLEKRLATWTTIDDETLQLEVGDATTPDYAGSGTTASTGGGIYQVAIRQFQFTLVPGQEDRWVYTIQMVSKLRNGITFS
tara:strand:- start:212 stop:757 length:546 start_codon:yes stop_codon:yes gene_type:complete